MGSMSTVRILLLVLLAAAMAGCGISRLAPVVDGSREAPPGTYRVVRGDTLHGIAFRFGLDYREIARWNRLRSPDIIYAGQMLRLHPPGSPPPARVAAATAPPAPAPAASTTPAAVARPAAPPTAQETESGPPSRAGTRTVASLQWGWPTEGQVVRTFNPDVPGRRGVQIAGTVGQSVQAASGGTVVYSGSGLPGYGRLIILKHANNLLSAYGYLGRIVVNEGDSVGLGQKIAELGTSADNRPVLHFEIRENGNPVNPLRFLPG